MAPIEFFHESNPDIPIAIMEDPGKDQITAGAIPIGKKIHPWISVTAVEEQGNITLRATEIFDGWQNEPEKSINITFLSWNTTPLQRLFQGYFVQHTTRNPPNGIPVIHTGYRGGIAV